MSVIELTSGDRVPALGFGTWQLWGDTATTAVAEALRVGYRHIDCAWIYENEVEVGRALAGALASGLVKRDELWVTSKLWNDSHARDDVRPALEQTLSDLGLDYLDLYLVHWPLAIRKEATFPLKPSDLIPLDEQPMAATWEAMESLVDAGLCRNIGVSNFSAAKLEQLCAGARVKPVMNQVELHPYLQQPALYDYCAAAGIALTGYSPLGAPDRPLEGAPVLLEDPTIGAIAERLGATPAQVLIRWAIERGTAVIPKSVTPARIAENFAAAELSLTADDMAAIAALDRHQRCNDGAIYTLEGSGYTPESLWDEPT